MKKLIGGLVLVGVIFAAAISVFPLDTMESAYNVSINQIYNDSLSGTDDTVDWYKFTISGDGGLAVFIESPFFIMYQVGITLYYQDPGTGKINEIDHDDNIAEMKNVSGACRAGTYYVKVEIKDSDVLIIPFDYIIGFAFSDKTENLAFGANLIRRELDLDNNAVTWILLVNQNKDDSFDPDIYLFDDKTLVGMSVLREGFDYICWPINGGIGKSHFDCLISSSDGYGNFWMMVVTYHLPPEG